MTGHMSLGENSTSNIGSADVSEEPVPCRRDLLDIEPWDYAAFRAEHLEHYLVDTVEAFMKEMNF